ncbi:glycoside hydrolase [Hysterangium stoloniferum]|nr:glycoside hydrolase [Hysterangium stoloniferum]
MSSYANINQTNGTSDWLDRQTRRNRRYKWTVIGGVVVALAIVVAVAVGITVSKNNKNNKNNDSTPAPSSGNGNGTSGVVSSNPDDPSDFQKDPNLHQSFYGLAYTPEGALLPDCGANIGKTAVIEDIQLISQLTTRIRLYGADCNQTSLVLDAIQRTKVNLTVYVGNYVVPGNTTAYQSQRDELEAAFKAFGVDHVSGVTVGNEFMLNYLTDNGGSTLDINGAVADTGAGILNGMIQDTRTWLQGLNLPKTLPVGTSDAGSYFNNKVLGAVDYGASQFRLSSTIFMANVHAWFASVDASQASGWVADFFQNTNIAEAQALSNKPQMFIAETGWPSAANDTAHSTNGPGVASITGLQTFLDDFICQANANGTGYFYFEFFDEKWKDVQFGGVEGHWGLFNANKTLKAVTIPKC